MVEPGRFYLLYVVWPMHSLKAIWQFLWGFDLWVNGCPLGKIVLAWYAGYRLWELYKSRTFAE